jgi:hypothetical protein
MRRELWVLSICDTEPDCEFYGGMPITQRSGPQSWEGVKEGLTEFIEYCNLIRDDEGLPLRLTLFIRSDLQIAEFYGRPGWALYHFSPLWDQFMTRGHEIGWHPHLWRWSDNQKKWYQEILDEKWMIEECLKPGYEDFNTYLPAKIVRMGWCYHNNCSIALMDHLGVMADFSGLSGIVSGMHNGLPMRGFNVYDWSLTPNYPYYPSEKDYRRLPHEGEKSLSILEVPQDTLRVSAVMNTIRALKKMVQLQKIHHIRRMAISMDAQRLLYVRRFIKNHISRVIQKEKPVILSWSLHADDLLSNTNLKRVFRNIQRLQHMARKANVELRFKTASEIAEYFKISNI